MRFRVKAVSGLGSCTVLGSVHIILWHSRRMLVFVHIGGVGLQTFDPTLSYTPCMFLRNHQAKKSYCICLSPNL